MKLNRIILLIFFILIFFSNKRIAGLETKMIAQVDNKIITSEDLKKEKVLIKYLYSNRINEKNLHDLAIKNLIEYTVKLNEIEKNSKLISESESKKYVSIILKNNNKSLDDFREKTHEKIYEKYLIKKIQIDISWNQLITEKFINNLNVNIDELLIKNDSKNESSYLSNSLILNEKNKKLYSLSDAYFNEVKNKTLIKYL